MHARVTIRTIELSRRVEEVLAVTRHRVSPAILSQQVHDAVQNFRKEHSDLLKYTLLFHILDSLP